MSYCLNPDCPKPQNPDSAKFCLTCGAKLRLGDRYRAIKPIGQGGFGRTFLAIDEYKPSHPRCVIKQFFPQFQTGNHAQKAAELFHREAIRLDELGKHPQIPELLAHFEQDRQQYLVQEFIEGQTLGDELAENGVFNEIQIWQLLNDLLPVLQFVHERQVVHRDIKPENIIRRWGDNKLVLVDFGASKFATNTEFEKTGTAIGSVGYSAPEQSLGRAVAASDLYGLGVTCIYLLSNISPIELFDINQGSWNWRKYLQTPVSSSLGRILDHLLEMNLNQRYPSAAEVLKDLENVRGKPPGTNFASPPPGAKSTAARPGNTPQNPPGNQSVISKFLGVTTQVIKGRIMQGLGNYEEAIASYEKAIQFKPNNYEAWYKKGRICAELHRYDEALACYEQALEIHPEHGDAWRDRALALYSLKDYEEAITSFDRALQISPNQAVIWFCRSMALKQSGRNREAQTSFEKGRQLLPKNPIDKASVMLQAWESLIR